MKASSSLALTGSIFADLLDEGKVSGTIRKDRFKIWTHEQGCGGESQMAAKVERIAVSAEIHVTSTLLTSKSRIEL